jgi:hypothetical protein
MFNIAHFTKILFGSRRYVLPTPGVGRDVAFCEWGPINFRRNWRRVALIALRCGFGEGMQLAPDECSTTHAADPLRLPNARDGAGTAGLPFS